MFKLKSLAFDGFRTSKHKARVDFSNELVTVIFGDNGSGKTTYLRAINAFLSQDSSYLDTIAVQSITCEFFYDEIESIYDNEGNVVEKRVVATDLPGRLHVGKINGQYDWSEYEQSPLIGTKSLSLGVDRGVATQQARVEPEVILNYFLHPRNRVHLKSITNLRETGIHELAEDLSRHIRAWQVNSSRSKRSEFRLDSSHVNLQNIKLENVEQILLEHYNWARQMVTKRIQNALFDTMAFAVSDETSDEVDIARDAFMANLKNSRLRLIEALSDDESNNEFKSIIISKLKDLDSFESYDAIFDKTLLKTLLWNMMGQLTLERLLLNSVNLLVEKFNNYLVDNKVLKISDEKAYVEVDGRELSVSDLSSGERHILTFLTLVLFQGRQRNFLIIDEPEISLNIKWQRELMELLHNLAPQTQIIVASHSPALAKRNPGYLAELQVDKGMVDG